MKDLSAWARGVVAAFGGPGLFVVAFLDSSFLSFPLINDILIVGMVTRHKERWAFYASMSTLGSLVGCFVLYWLAWKGGEAFLRRRFRAGAVDRGMRAVRRYGLLTLLVPSILPPPAPFKIFVLLAGVARVEPGSFALAIGLGRGLRYFGEALLAVWYGDRAVDYIRSHGSQVAVAVAALVLLGGIAWVWSRNRRARRPE